MSNKPKILIVDDDQDILEVMESNLNRIYQVVTAENGLVAMNYLEKEEFDLILLDIMMPDMDGFELAKQLRQKKIDIPFIFVTAKTLYEDKLKGFELGAEDYIIKPFRRDELILRINRKLYNCNKIKVRNKRLELISHNIITPINSVRGGLQLLDMLFQTLVENKLNINDETVYQWKSDDFLEFKTQFYDTLKIADSGADQILQMITKYQELFNKIDIQLYKEKVNLTHLLSDKNLYGLTNLECKFLEPIPDIQLYIDRDKIIKAIYEILDNACLHNDHKVPIVEISVHYTDSNLTIYFTDNGRGIDPDHFENVFEEFWTGQDNIHHTRGDGIGLWLCKKYIESHFGTIWIERSKINQGTTVAISIPLKQFID